MNNKFVIGKIRKKIFCLLTRGRERLQSNSGAVAIVESAYVFPIMFFVIFFLIYFGNMYYVKSAVDSITSLEAIKGAQYYANPWVQEVHETNHDGSVPTENKDVEPYRKIFSDKEIQNQIQEETLQKIKDFGGGTFAGMEAKKISCTATYKNYFVSGTFSVQVTYQISFPIRFLGTSEPMVLDFSAYDTAMVSDNSEFIRNTDMVIDYIERSVLFNAVKEKVTEVLGKFK